MNKVVLIGRVCKDPELTYTAGNGTAVCKFNLAVTRQFKKDETDFLNCIAFGKAGETIAQYITKGRQLAVTGNIRTGSYDAKDGTKRYTTEIVVEGFEFIGSNKSDNQGGPSQGNNQDSFYDDITPIDDEDGMPF